LPDRGHSGFAEVRLRGRVYVIDAARNPADPLSSVLSGAGYALSFHPTAAAFLAAAAVPGPILLAIGDAEDGLGELALIRSEAPAWPVVALAPADDAALAARALGAGATDVLAAPFTTDELLLVLDAVAALAAPDALSRV